MDISITAKSIETKSVKDITLVALLQSEFI